MRKKAELRPPEPRLSLADWSDAESVFQARRAALVPIDQPLVLISQIQRSGGTLLNSLLDGHPQLHVHPWEIQVGHPTRPTGREWTSMRASRPGSSPIRAVAVAVFRPGIGRIGSEVRWRRNRPAADDRAVVRRAPVSRARRGRAPTLLASPRPLLHGVLQRLAGLPGTLGGAEAVAGGLLPAAGLGGEPQPVAARLPRRQAGRDPARSARLVRVRSVPSGRATATSTSRSTSGEPAPTRSREPSARRPTRSSSLTYERLVTEPEAVTRSLAAWLGIDWAPSLLEPSFNRQPVPPIRASRSRRAASGRSR